MRARFDDLSEEVAEDQLLREILGTDHDVIRMSGAGRYGYE
jgi:hypothetical protein